MLLFIMRSYISKFFANIAFSSINSFLGFVSSPIHSSVSGVVKAIEKRLNGYRKPGGCYHY